MPGTELHRKENPEPRLYSLHHNTRNMQIVCLKEIAQIEGRRKKTFHWIQKCNIGLDTSLWCTNLAPSQQWYSEKIVCRILYVIGIFTLWYWLPTSYVLFCCYRNFHCVVLTINLVCTLLLLYEFSLCGTDYQHRRYSSVVMGIFILCKHPSF